MKRLTALFLTLLLLLSACAPLPPEPTEIETEPASPSQETANSPQEDDGSRSWDASSDEDAPIYFDQVKLVNATDRDEAGAYLVYAGETMQLDLSLSAIGLSEEGIAVYLYLDGQLQPFRLEEDGALAYTHTIYPDEYGNTSLAALYFTPALGQTGDRLKLTLQFQAHPGYIRGQELSTGYIGNELTDLELPRTIATQLKFEADPPALELPEAEKSLLSWSVTCETPTVATETYKRGYPSAGFTVNGVHSIDPLVYNVKSGDTLQLRYKLFSLPAGQYSLVFLLNGQPVSTDPADWIHFEAEDGQEAVVEAELILNDYEGVGKVTAVYMRRDGVDKVDSPNPVFYLTAAGYYEAHVELVSGEE